MENFKRQGGVAFFLLYYTAREEFYYLRLAQLLSFWQRMLDGGRKSFRYKELDQDFIFKSTGGVLVPYLDALQKDLLLKD